MQEFRKRGGGGRKRKKRKKVKLNEITTSK